MRLAAGNVVLLHADANDLVVWLFGQRFRRILEDTHNGFSLCGCGLAALRRLLRELLLLLPGLLCLEHHLLKLAHLPRLTDIPGLREFTEVLHNLEDRLPLLGGRAVERERVL